MDTVILDSTNTKIDPNVYGQSFWGTRAKVNGADAFIIPKSYVERGFVAGDKQFFNPSFLNPNVWTYLKPVTVSKDIEKSAVELLNKFEWGKGNETMPGWKDPSYDDGAYVIDFQKAQDLNISNIGKNGAPNWQSLESSGVRHSPITGMAEVNGKLTYVGTQAQPGHTSTYTTYSEKGEGQTSYTWQNKGRGGLLGDIGRFVDSLGPLTLALNFVSPGAGTALYAGRQVAQGNWGNAILSIALANVPGADGATTSGLEGTFLEIPSIAEATKTIQTTLGISSTAASAIMAGTLQTMANGGNLEDAFKNVATSYVGNIAGNYVGDLMNNQGFKDLATISSNVAKTSTTAWLRNENVVDAAKVGFMSSAIPIALKEIPGFSDLSQSQKTAITRIATQAAMRPDANLGDILKNTGINLAVDTVLGENSTYKALPPMYQDLIRNSVISVAQDKPLDKTLSSFISSQAQQQVKQYESKAQYLNSPIQTKEELKNSAQTAIDNMQFALQQSGNTGYANDNVTWGTEYQQLVKDILGPDAPPWSPWKSSPYGQLMKEVGFTTNNISEEDIATRLYQYKQKLDNSVTTPDEATAYFYSQLGRNPTSSELSLLTGSSKNEAYTVDEINRLKQIQDQFKNIVGREPTADELEIARVTPNRDDYIKGKADSYISPAPAPAPAPEVIVIPDESGNQLVIDQNGNLVDIIPPSETFPEPVPEPAPKPVAEPIEEPAPVEPEPVLPEAIAPLEPQAPTDQIPEVITLPPDEDGNQLVIDQNGNIVDIIPPAEPDVVEPVPVEPVEPPVTEPVTKPVPEVITLPPDENGNQYVIDTDGNVVDIIPPSEPEQPEPTTPPFQGPMGPMTEDQIKRYNDEFAKYLDYLQAGQPLPPEYGVQDLGITPENWESFNENLLTMQQEGKLPTQWKPGADGSFTFTSDDGSTLTIDDSGNILGYTEAPIGNLPGEVPAGGGTTTGGGKLPTGGGGTPTGGGKPTGGTGPTQAQSGLGLLSMLPILATQQPSEQVKPFYSPTVQYVDVEDPFQIVGLGNNQNTKTTNMASGGYLDELLAQFERRN